MADRIKVEIYRSGVRRVLRQPYMVQDIDRRVQRMRRYGVFRSPVKTGQYSRSWFSYAGLRNGVAYGRVGNSAPHAWFVERDTHDDDGKVRTHGQYVVQETLRVAVP